MAPTLILGCGGEAELLEMTAEMECRRENNSEPTKERDNQRKTVLFYASSAYHEQSLTP